MYQYLKDKERIDTMSQFNKHIRTRVNSTNLSINEFKNTAEIKIKSLEYYNKINKIQLYQTSFDRNYYKKVEDSNKVNLNEVNKYKILYNDFNKIPHIEEPEKDDEEENEEELIKDDTSLSNSINNNNKISKNKSGRQIHITIYDDNTLKKVLDRINYLYNKKISLFNYLL